MPGNHHEIERGDNKKSHIGIAGEEMGELDGQHRERQERRRQKPHRRAIKTPAEKKEEQYCARIEQGRQHATDDSEVMVFDAAHPVQDIGRQRPVRRQPRKQERGDPLCQPGRRHTRIERDMPISKISRSVL